MKYIIGAVITITTAGLFLTAPFISPASFDLREVIDADSRNAGVTARAYYGNRVNWNVLVFDIRDLDGNKSRADVTRVLLQFAESQKERSYERVVLAYRGDHRVFLSGEYFKQIGDEYAWQNPVYTVRTMPENVFELDGTRAFGAWSGGLFGVLNGQLEDSNRFHDEWYLDDLLARLGGS